MAKHRSLVSREKRAIALLITLLNGLTWVGIVLLWMQTIASYTWIPVEGEIDSSHITRHTNMRGTVSYRLELRYCYDAGGERFCGQDFKIGGFNPNSSSQSHLSPLQQQYSPGKKAIAYYDPNRRDRSVLQPGLNADIFGVTGMGLILLAANIAVWIWLAGKTAQK